MGLAITITLTLMAATASIAFFGRELANDLKDRKNVLIKIGLVLSTVGMTAMSAGFAFSISFVLAIALDVPGYQDELAWGREYDHIVYDGSKNHYICKNDDGDEEELNVSEKYVKIERGGNRVSVEKYQGESPMLKIVTDYYVVTIPDDMVVAYIGKEKDTA